MSAHLQRARREIAEEERIEICQFFFPSAASRVGIVWLLELGREISGNERTNPKPTCASQTDVSVH
jgi:hypothetical protein